MICSEKNFFVPAAPKIFVDLRWFMKYAAAADMLVQKTQIGIACGEDWRKK